MKTSWVSKKDIGRKWYVVDVADVILGRAATQIASLLIGKSKVNRVPNMDCGDYVIVVNASKLKVSGNKMQDKKYYRHSGYAGGLKEKTLEEMMKTQPEEVVRNAVKKMLPQNKLQSSMITRLYVYAGPDHDQAAQKPEKFEIKS